MKITILLLLLSTIAWAGKKAAPAVTPNFFDVDTDTSEIRPDKQVAIDHYKNRIKKLEAERPTRKSTGMSASDRIENNRAINPSM